MNCRFGQFIRPLFIFKLDADDGRVERIQRQSMEMTNGSSLKLEKEVSFGKLRVSIIVNPLGINID